MPVSRDLMKYLNGKCFDFALALALKIDNPVFVAVGNPKFPHHVGIKIGGLYADVRGLSDEVDFLAHHAGERITEVDRSALEFHCGLLDLDPPYRGSKDIAQAKRAVKSVFPGKITA